MKTAASTAKTLGSSMGTLNRDIHAFQAGAMQIDEALGAASVRIKGGGALGYTGLNALQFSFGQNAAERSALLAEFGGKTSPENLAKMLQFLEQISHNTRQQVGEIQAQRTQAISGAPQAYGMYRFMSQMGVMNPGAGGAPLLPARPCWTNTTSCSRTSMPRTPVASTAPASPNAMTSPARCRMPWVSSAGGCAIWNSPAILITSAIICSPRPVSARWRITRGA